MTGQTLTDSYTYTITDADGDTSTATLTITIAGTNDAPIVGTSSATLSEEGLAGGLADTSGNPSDTTNLITRSGIISITDPDSVPTVTLSGPSGLTSGGVAVVWSGSGTVASPLIGTAGGVEVFRATISNGGAYTVTLSKAIDHVSANGENLKDITLTVSANDGVAPVSNGTLVVTIEDDAPVTVATTSTVAVSIDTISIDSLKAGWINQSYTNGTTNTSASNTDGDAYNDRLRWGTTSGTQSGYDLVDAGAFSSSSGTAVTVSQPFKLADFTHLNWPVSGSSLDKVEMVMTMNVVINGISTPISFNVLLDHTETPNVSGDPVASRDIITLPAQDVSVNVAGQDYVFRLEGFRDANGNLVNTIYTDESANNTYGIWGSVNTTDTLPVVSGSINAQPGADGLGSVTWGSLTSSYGTMTANADGTYSFQVNRTTRESMTYGDVLTQTFSYTITDKDGDAIPGSVTIEIRAPEVINLTATTATITSNLGLAGEYFGHNDNRNGSTADPKYNGSTATRYHADDGTADAGAVNNVDTLADVEEIVELRNADTTLVGSARLSSTSASDATFSANKMEFGLAPGSNTPLFNNDLGQNGRVESGAIGATAAVGGTNNLYTFLNVASNNVDGLTATSGLGDTTDAIIRMVGYIYVPAGGVFDMRVTADDGYRVLVNGVNVGEVDQNQSTSVQIHTGITLTEGLQPIEILYWDQAGHASLRVELKTSGAADSTYKVIGTDEYALFSPSNVPTLGATQDIVESSTNGTWQIRTGQDYTGTSADERIVGSDGKDVVHAGGGDDAILGGAGSDTLYGGAGNDVLTGGLGSDTFAWVLADQGSSTLPAKDIVTDFSAASKILGGDALDLRDLLPNGATNATTLDGYLNFSKSGSDTVIDVRPSGASGQVTQQIVLAGVDLTSNSTLSDQQIIQDLLNKGKLITD